MTLKRQICLHLGRGRNALVLDELKNSYSTRECVHKCTLSTFTLIIRWDGYTKRPWRDQIWRLYVLSEARDLLPNSEQPYIKHNNNQKNSITLIGPSRDSNPRPHYQQSHTPITSLSRQNYNINAFRVHDKIGRMW